MVFTINQSTATVPIANQSHNKDTIHETHVSSTMKAERPDAPEKDIEVGRLCRTTLNDLKMYMKNVIYSIPCECRVQYIGEAGKPLQVRIREHTKNVKEGKTISSRLVEHM